MKTRGGTLAACCLLLACSSTDRINDPFESGTSGNTSPTTGPTGVTTSATTSDGTGADSVSGGTGAKFDVGTGMTTGLTGNSDGDIGCQKVDFVFVVDSSGSMEDEQMKLVQNFPPFIQTIQATLTAMDYQIIVVDSDAAAINGSGSSCSNGDCTCNPAPGCCHTICGNGTATTCNGAACNNLPPVPCEEALGGGKRDSSMGADCGIVGPQRYMTNAQTDLETTFSCLATVGIDGSGDEQTIGAAVNAVSAPFVGPGGCNEGFLRDDAILVVTFLTDEDDGGGGLGLGGSPGDPMDWFNDLVAAKNGDPTAIVVLGLFGESPGVPCVNGDADPGVRLRQFVDLFPNGLVGSVCDDDYQPLFEEAVGLIDGTCDDFVPPG